MSSSLSLALIINLSALLILSWILFLVIIHRLQKQKAELGSSATQAHDDELTELQEQNDAQLESANRVYSTINAMDDDDELVSDLMREVAHLQNELEKTSLMLSNRRTSWHPFKKNQEEPDPSRNTISSLRFKLNNARAENNKMRSEMDRLERQNKSLKRYRNEHRILKERVNQFLHQTEKNDRLINQLRSKLKATQTAAQEAQQALMRLKQEPTGNTDQELKEALDRAERERQFLEEQYMELLKQLEEAENISDELERSQSECKQLEQAYNALLDEMNHREQEEQQEELDAEKAHQNIINETKSMTEEEIMAKNKQWLESMEKEGR